MDILVQGTKNENSEFGQVVGGLCAVTGMLITGLPIPLIAANFHLYHSSAKLHQKLLQRVKSKPGTRKGWKESSWRGSASSTICNSTLGAVHK